MTQFSYPLESVSPRDCEVGLSVEVDDGEELVERVGVGGAEALHHLQSLLLVSLNWTNSAFSYPFSTKVLDIMGSNSYLLEVPVGRVREEEESRDEEDGEGGGGDGHPVPAGDGAQGVGQKGAC